VRDCAWREKKEEEVPAGDRKTTGEMGGSLGVLSLEKKEGVAAAQLLWEENSEKEKATSERRQRDHQIETGEEKREAILLSLESRKGKALFLLKERGFLGEIRPSTRT